MTASDTLTATVGVSLFLSIRQRCFNTNPPRRCRATGALFSLSWAGAGIF